MWHPFCRHLTAIALSIDNAGTAIAHSIQEGFQLMATTLNEALSNLNVATNNIAEEVAELRSQLGNVATPEQLAQMDAISTRLNSLAADPNNPVPETPPTDASR
jgi:hypothetical protein